MDLFAESWSESNLKKGGRLLSVRKSYSIVGRHSGRSALRVLRGTGPSASSGRAGERRDPFVPGRTTAVGGKQKGGWRRGTLERVPTLSEHKVLILGRNGGKSLKSTNVLLDGVDGEN